MDYRDCDRRAATHRGQVVASFGRRTLVETIDGQTISCVSRGRRRGIVCGDNVRFELSAPGAGVIEEIYPRSCLIYRSDGRKEKAIAANITQVVIVLAVLPVPRQDFIDRCLVAAEHAQAEVVLVLNKTDLLEAHPQAALLAARYGELGYRTIPLSIHSSVDVLTAELQDHLSLLIGQSGVGKSTLVNRLLPNAKARVADAAAASHIGRHTTTHAELYRLTRESALIDSPGMHAFGLGHLSPMQVAEGFIEFRDVLGHCRFSNCRHDGELGCALAEAVQQGRILAERVSSYRRILESIS